MSENNDLATVTENERSESYSPESADSPTLSSSVR